MLVLACGSSAVFDGPAPASAASAALVRKSASKADIAQVRADILKLTNKRRSDAKLKPLKASKKVQTVAQNWSAVQARKKKMHHNPNGSKQIPKGWRKYGENVAAGHASARSVVSAWHGSEGHRKNMLGDFTHIGVGLAYSEDGVPYYTQVFGKYPKGVPGERSRAKFKKTSRPKISGVRKTGRVLTAKRGTWKPGGAKFSYRWLRNGKNIAGATKAKYRLTSADKNKRIRVKVTGKKSGVKTTSRTSTATARIR
nr:CAP domain-containing protein [Leucobacter weissii]